MTDDTWEEIHSAIAEDCYSLYFDGIQVGGKTFYFAMVGVKGDWVYLRKAFWLDTGFRSLRICHSCPSRAWWRFGAQSELCTWNGEGPAPWRTDINPAPLRSIPGGDSANRVKNDPAHCWSIGVGKEFAASCILLLCHLGIWQGSNIGTKLVGAFEHFQAWRYTHKQTSKIHQFSLKTFGIQSLQQYPVLKGSGSDCIVVCKWLGSLLTDDAMKPQFVDCISMECLFRQLLL